MTPELRRLPDTPRGHPCQEGCSGVHSYTSTGARWCWAGAMRGRQALDAEDTSVEPPEQLARRAGDVDFWVEWTRMEVISKLTNTPVWAALVPGRFAEPAPDGVVVEHRRFGDEIVCLGWLNE